jgi:UDP-N-acetylglucosamine 2-epimerase
VAHVEAGMRSYNRLMPEETNRIAADHVSTFLLCPTETAVSNLAREGIRDSSIGDDPIQRVVRNVGDVMYDALLQEKNRIDARSGLLEMFGLTPGSYVLATVHRAENTDHPDRLREILGGFLEVARTGHRVALPLHPRTAVALRSVEIPDHPNFKILDPVTYLDMLCLLERAGAAVTDSGGVQKEAFLLGVPCVTLRDETEWPETLSGGWNQLVGASKDRILEVTHRLLSGDRPEIMEGPNPFGSGNASELIVHTLLEERGG